MLSESTARLVENTAVLGEPEMVHIKGADDPMPTRRLLAVGEHRPRLRGESSLVGRTWELNTITGILEDAISGAGYVVNIVGPPGIGKSRLVRETAAIAAARGVAVFTTYCESHASDIPFHVVARFLRTASGVNDLNDQAARARLRAQVPDADSDDLLLLDDLLGIADAAVALPDIAPDARRRRLAALVNAAALARQEPAVYVIEDAHWIDEVSESMLAELMAVIPQTRLLVLITYRPEYHGALTRVSGVQTIALRPLSDAQASALTAELLGADPSIGELAAQVAARAAGNPFFVEEMVRDLAERGVLHGRPGAYQLRGDVADVEVPATLQATIGARIDRLDPTAKHTLNAAAVIGSRFDADLLTALGRRRGRGPADRGGARRSGEVHRAGRVCVSPSADPHGGLRITTQIRSRAAAPAAGRRDRTARSGLGRRERGADRRASGGRRRSARGLRLAHARRDLVDQPRHRRGAHELAAGPAGRRSAARRRPGSASMRIAPRTLLCGSAWRVGGSGADTGFDELRDLCTAAGDQRSLAIGMTGQVMAQFTNAHRRGASRLASEHIALLESIGDPTLTVGLSFAALVAKQETAEMAEVLRVAQRVIDLADGDPTMGDLIIGSPLAVAIACAGRARWCLGIPGWKDDFHQAVAMARAVRPDHACRCDVVHVRSRDPVRGAAARCDHAARHRRSAGARGAVR